MTLFPKALYACTERNELQEQCFPDVVLVVTGFFCCVPCSNRISSLPIMWNHHPAFIALSVSSRIPIP